MAGVFAPAHFIVVIRGNLRAVHGAVVEPHKPVDPIDALLQPGIVKISELDQAPDHIAA
ncbi:hypothetical protein SDC9_162300 [bioreactor metagenome]|uniref:Uncharacterized protein n=1 Tax=bioreactor metagenome TaxID=1076179 RepID=A0A645FKQ7_9ZZZZ